MLTTVGQVTSFKASKEFFDKVEAEDKEIKLFKVGCASMRALRINCHEADSGRRRAATTSWCRSRRG